MHNSMADFDVKSAIELCPGPELGTTVSADLGRIAVRMAELLMKSAIPSEGPIRTSWPALRNPCCANEITKHGGKGEWQTSVQSLPIYNVAKLGTFDDMHVVRTDSGIIKVDVPLVYVSRNVGSQSPSARSHTLEIYELRQICFDAERVVLIFYSDRQVR